MSDKKQLIKIDDVYKDRALAVSHNELNVYLNNPPKEKWIKEHPTIKKEVVINGQKVKVPITYLPISRVEYLLTAIFTEWSVEIKETQLLANAIVVTIRLHYRNPITGEMKYQDGIGASPVQTDKGASATDWTKIKTAAVMMAAPAAKSFAVKDAAEQLGKLFGKDLNRADDIVYTALQNRFVEPINMESLLSEVIELIDKLPEDKQLAYKEILADKKKSGELSIKLIEDMKKQVEGGI